MSDQDLKSRNTDPKVDELARLLGDAFGQYHEMFLDLTQRASHCFRNRDWAKHQQDTNTRLNLHKKLVFQVVDKAREVFTPDHPTARKLWLNVRRRYVNLVSQRLDLELAETFYNSVTRRLFGIIGLDEELEFTWLGPTKLPNDDASSGEYSQFKVDNNTEACVKRICEQSSLAAYFVDIDQDAHNVASRVNTHLSRAWDGHLATIDILAPIFYRNKGAYIVGRLRWLNRVAPFVVALVHSDEGVEVDAVLLTETDVSRLFGYTRSYFHVECKRPAAVVGFLKSFLPVKPVAELYTSIGYNQHGKTNLFRALYRHMDHSNTRFERARGARGMVMVVFTLPSFDVVFKLIKDRFAPTKRSTPEEVKRRYKLVFGHDRVGRLVDAQEFTNLSFNRDRFDEDLIDELRNECSRNVTITSDHVILHHAYTERRLYPLDLYLREMSADRARAAAIDYGYAIKDLAAANIFPGDLFPKNFGVTRHGVVVFYDYDELALLNEINFRVMPVSQTYEDEISDQPWFPVASNDVFPEEFRTYLRSPRIIGEVMTTRHSDICTVEFWRSMQQVHQNGELPDFFPYPPETRITD